MTEAEWLESGNPVEMLEFLWRRANLRHVRLFGFAVCRLIWGCLTHHYSRRAVIAAEQHADGLVDEHVLKSRQKDAAAVHQMVTDADIFDQRKAAVFEAVQLEPRDAANAATSVAARCSEPWPIYYAPVVGERAASAAAWAGMGATLESYQAVGLAESAAQANLLRDIFGNPFRPVEFDPAWRRDTALTLARQMYESREFSAMPILADALQDAGCDNEDVLNHCRDANATHVRGCWVVDLVLEKV